MSNEFREHGSHSAEYFGDTRDHWWNRDFIDLMAARWRLAEAREVLDVGCGVGHWGQLLGRVLPADARVTGIDRDPFWVEKATERAKSRGLDGRYRYLESVAEALPFPDGSFDLVTCQTVLIHARDPRASLAEMIRVTKPGGLVAVAEPNNAASSLVLDSTLFDAPVEEVLSLVRFQLLCERGKQALGEGNNSLGDIVPGLFAEAGLEGVQVCTSDKAGPLSPPYASPEQRALVEEMLDLASRDFWIWSREDTRRYFLASGATEGDFEACWGAAMQQKQRAAAAIRAGTYTNGGGSILYLVSGRKPAPREAQSSA